jgi:hypothetical protein
LSWFAQDLPSFSMESPMSWDFPPATLASATPTPYCPQCQQTRIVDYPSSPKSHSKWQTQDSTLVSTPDSSPCSAAS